MTTTVAPVTTTIADALESLSESWHDTEAGHHLSVGSYVFGLVWISITFAFYVKPDDAWSNWSSKETIEFCNGHVRARFYLRWWIQITFGLFSLFPLLFFFCEFLFCCCFCCGSTFKGANHRLKMSTVLCNSGAIVQKADKVRFAQVAPDSDSSQVESDIEAQEQNTIPVAVPVKSRDMLRM